MRRKKEGKSNKTLGKGKWFRQWNKKKYRQLTKDLSKRKMEQDKKYGKKGVSYLLTWSKEKKSNMADGESFRDRWWKIRYNVRIKKE